MSKWNYRVIEFMCPVDKEPWRAIHEVYYDEDGKPCLYTEKPAEVSSSEADGFDLSVVLDRMRLALELPVLVERDFTAPEERSDDSGI